MSAQPPPSKKVKTVASTSSSTAAKPVAVESLEEDYLLEDGFGQYSSDEDERDEEEPAAAVSSGKSSSMHPSRLGLATTGDNDDEKEATSKKRKIKKAKATTITTTNEDGTTTETIKEKKPKKIKPGRVLETSLGLLSAVELVSKLAEKQRKAMPNLSQIEMEDMRVDESMLIDTSTVSERKDLAEFIRAAIPGLSSTLGKPPKKQGSPRVIVIAGAALRVADLCREARPFKSKDIDVAKLFSKHFKLAEHVEYLDKTKVSVAVAAPNRIGKLLSETSALHLTHLSHLIFDVSHLDSKNRSLLDMPEAFEDIFRHVLGNKGIMDRLREGRMKIVMY